MQLLPSPIDHYTRQDSASSKYRPGFFHKEEAERIFPDVYTLLVRSLINII